MIVRQIPVGPMKNFDYLLMDEVSREAIAVDSGWETNPVVAAAKEGKMKVLYAVATHGHFDHVETLSELAGKLGAKTVAHASSELTTDVRVKGGDHLKVGGKDVQIIHTPGHTPDSICLFDGSKLFTGDTLFIGNCGRTDLPGGSTSELFHSLHAVLMELPGETIIYPGHDYGAVRSRSLREEMRLNPTLLARDLREFAGVE
jgi:glyoxylase-like metal-dependent hydrolase (beta-lactamase superfamily II)